MGLYNETGWNDNVSAFTTQAAGGITEPAFENMGNGLYAHGFTDGEALVIQHHINHDVKPDGETYFHVHWAPSTAMTVGQTISWTIDYTKAKGHHQGDSFGSVTTSIVLTYTADGTEIALEHMILESTTPIVTPEPDSIIVSKITYGHGTYVAKCYGFTMDLHYEVDRNATPNKVPNFYN
jgi:hypothetical protein